MAEIELTDKQARFIEEYLIDFNATQAAIRAGYSQDTAKQIGSQNLSKVYLREKIDERLKQMSLTAEETTKLIADIARSSLNDYFTTTTKEIIPKKRVLLSVIISQLIEEIEFETEFAKLADFNADELNIHQQQQSARNRDLIRLQLRFKRNPNTTALIDGEPEIIEITDLDLPRLVKDRNAGKIKSMKHTDSGIQVEMYAADAALTNLARMYGLFEKDNERKLTGNLSLSELPITFK